MVILCTHGHPSLHSWSPLSALMVTLLCTHGHPSLHSWSPFSAPMVTFFALMITLLCTHGHPSLHSWSSFSALMVTFLYTLGHPSLHPWLPFQVFFLIDESEQIGKGSNTVVSLLHAYFSLHGLGERQATLQADNCVGQNKNKAMIWYLAWRIICNLHDRIELNFMLPGHTKFRPCIPQLFKDWNYYDWNSFFEQCFLPCTGIASYHTFIFSRVLLR